MLGPNRAGEAINSAEAKLYQIFAGRLSEREAKEATTAYGRLLAIASHAALDAGQFTRAERSARLAASVAIKAGDGQTAGQALTTLSGSARIAGRPHHALIASHKAHAYARTGPAAVGAMLVEAQAGASLSRVGVDSVFDAIKAAETEHSKIHTDRWGTP